MVKGLKKPQKCLWQVADAFANSMIWLGILRFFFFLMQIVNFHCKR